MKKEKSFLRVFATLIICFLVAFLLKYGNALTQDENHPKVISSIIMLNFSNNGFDFVVEENGRNKHVSIYKKKYPYGIAKEFMKNRGWKFVEQAGSALIFEKDGDVIDVETTQYTSDYYIWAVPVGIPR